MAAGSKVVGTISGASEVLIEGELEGEIQLDNRVVVGPRGKVKGNIVARSVHIAGHLVGNVQGLERVELGASATLEGDLTAPRVLIAEGAFFKGQVEMTGPQTGSGEVGAMAAARQQQGQQEASVQHQMSAEGQSRRVPGEGRNPEGS